MVSDTCGCVNLPCGEGGGQVLPLQYKHDCTETVTHTHTYLLMIVSFCLKGKCYILYLKVCGFY